MSMPAALARRRDYTGPALLSYGFRPFFLAAGLWAVFGILLWLPQYVGEFALRVMRGGVEALEDDETFEVSVHINKKSPGDYLTGA